MTDLLARAEAADETKSRTACRFRELALREKRLAKLAEARARIEAQARERYERERAEHEAKLRARGQDRRDRQEARRQAAAPLVEGPLPKDQINLTDADSRIMPTSGGGFEQSYNAQAVVAAGSLLVVAADVVQTKRQAAARTDAGQDRGSARTPGRGGNAAGGRRLFQRGECRGLPGGRIEPLIAMGRQPHQPRLASASRRRGPHRKIDARRGHGPSAETPEGRKLYALRKQTPEPVFGIIKSALGFRQFSLRGLDKVRAEWSLVTMVWNLKRMFVLAPA